MSTADHFGANAPRRLSLSLSETLHTLERITGHPPQRNGQGWVCRCPAHDDHTPSLSVSEGDHGKTLLYCHAGCSYEAVAAALDLDRKPDPQSPKNGARRPIATYSYRGTDGVEVRQKLRYAPKDFRIRHRDASGAWVYKAGSGPAVLYRGRLRKRKKSYAKPARRLAPSGIASEWTRRGSWPRPAAARR